MRPFARRRRFWPSSGILPISAISQRLACFRGSRQGIVLSSAALARGLGVRRRVTDFSQRRSASWVSRSQVVVGGNWVARSVGCDRRFAIARASSPTLCGAAAGLCRQRVGLGGAASLRVRASFAVWARAWEGAPREPCGGPKPEGGGPRRVAVSGLAPRSTPMISDAR